MNFAVKPGNKRPFYSASASGIGNKPTLAETVDSTGNFDPTSKTLPPNGHVNYPYDYRATMLVDIFDTYYVRNDVNVCRGFR